MNSIRYYFKLAHSGFVVFQFITILSFIKLIMKKSPKRRAIVAYFTRYYSRRLIKVAGIQFEIKGKFPKDDTYFIVCNHLSYIDILVLQAVFKQTCFIAAKDMMESNGLGTVIKNGNSYGIERRNRGHIEKDITEMQRILNNGFDLLMFAEGRTSNGDGVARFKEPLFDAAIRAKKKVLPITLNYVSIDNEPVSIKNRDIVYWYGRVPFLSHYKGICRKKVIKIEITVGQSLDTTNETSASISVKARNAVAKNFKSINPSQNNLAG